MRLTWQKALVLWLVFVAFYSVIYYQARQRKVVSQVFKWYDYSIWGYQTAHWTRIYHPVEIPLPLSSEQTGSHQSASWLFYVFYPAERIETMVRGTYFTHDHVMWPAAE